MIVQCSGCAARYRLDESRIPGGSSGLRCKKCGLLFFVTRPAADPSVDRTGPAAVPRPAPSRSATSRTALVASEPREFRDLVASVLGEAGFEVSLTDNGEEALLLAGSHRFDLIVLSVYLRKTLGINVCERIKAAPELKQTPVILIGNSLTAEGGSVPRARLHGADDFIQTTVGREELAARLRRLAETPGGTAPPPSEEGPAERPVSGDEGEIRRLARIMISDIQMYHPEKFARALKEGTFFEAFSEELGRGKEIVDQRFGQLANRIQILAAGLRDALEVLRGSTARSRIARGQ